MVAVVDTKVYKFDGETDLGGGILSIFAFLLAVTVQVTFIGSIAQGKGP